MAADPVLASLLPGTQGLGQALRPSHVSASHQAQTAISHGFKKVVCLLLRLERMCLS